MSTLQYLTDQNGDKTAVVVPIELWLRLLPEGDLNFEALIEKLEDFGLSCAMDLAEESPTLDREAALAFLEGP